MYTIQLQLLYDDKAAINTIQAVIIFHDTYSGKAFNNQHTLTI